MAFYVSSFTSEPLAQELGFTEANGEIRGTCIELGILGLNSLKGIAMTVEYNHDHAALLVAFYQPCNTNLSELEQPVTSYHIA